MGKSYAGNNILKSDDVFPVGYDDSFGIMVATRRMGARTVTVVDTPGPSETNIAEIEEHRMFQKSEPFILVLVMKHFDHTEFPEVPEKDRRSIQLLTEKLPDLFSR